MEKYKCKNCKQELTNEEHSLMEREGTIPETHNCGCLNDDGCICEFEKVIPSIRRKSQGYGYSSPNSAKLDQLEANFNKNTETVEKWFTNQDIKNKANDRINRIYLIALVALAAFMMFVIWYMFYGKTTS